MKKIIILIVVVCTLSFFNQKVVGEDNDGSKIFSAETITGTIDPKIDIDTYTFDGIANQTVMIFASSESGDMGPQIDLYSNDDIKLVGDWSSSYTNIIYKLKSSGTYSIIVRDAYADETGEYSLSLLLIPGSTTSAIDSDGGIINSNEIKTGNIDYKSDVDIFTFNGNYGQSVLIQAGLESGNIEPLISLYSSEGTLEKQVWASTTAIIENHQLQSNGTYSITIRDAYGDEIGGYSLSLQIIGEGSSTAPDSGQDDINVDDEDDDNDGYTDYIEVIMGTDPLNPNSKPSDSDNDGIPDLIDDDDDNDGYTDYEENKEGTDPLSKTSYPNIEQQDTDKDGLPDSTDDDDDNDKYTDVQEIIERTNPLDLYSFPKDVAKFDTDVDGIFDSEDTDDDNDGMPDHWELFYGFNPLNDDDANDDMDKDVYSNLQEFKAGSNPRDKDSYPNKGLSIIEITLMAVSLISGMISLGGVVYAFYRNPVWMYKRKIKKTTTINELDKLWKNDIQPAIDNKKIKPKHIRKIKECYNKQKSDLIQKQKVQDINKKS